VGPTCRLRHDLVDDPEAEQILCGELEGVRRLDLAPGVAPQNRGTALRRDHAVDGELVHQDAIADGEPQRAAAAPLAVHEHDDGRIQSRHLTQVERDRFRDAALLRLDARVGGRGVDEGDHRPLELLRQLHRPQRFAVALRLRVPEVSIDLLFRIAAAALVVADDEHGSVFVAGEAGDDGMVVGKAAIAADLSEVGEEPRHVVQHRGTAGMPRHEHALPWREALVDVGTDRFHLPLQRVDRALLFRRLRHQRQGFDLLQQDSDGFLELERIGRHATSRYCTGRG